MDTNYFMGLLITAIVTLLTVATAITALIVKPIINLNKNIVKLESSIDMLNKSVNNIEARETKHGVEIDNINRELKLFEGRIAKIEGSKK